MGFVYKAYKDKRIILIPRILIYLLSISCFSTVVHAEIIEERGSLLEFFAGIEEGCEYDNWLSHVSEGIANAGYNVYAPVEHDRQTNGFGAYQIIDHLENPEEILVSWYDIFANVLSDQIEEADEILSNSAFADYYQIVRLQDGDRSYIILRELLNNEYVDDNGTEDDNDDVTGSFDYGWGLFIFNPDPTTPKVAIEVPHPCDDYVTPFVAIDAFLLLDARALIVSGAGREVEWTEEGEFNNGITRSDPTRLQNVSAFQEAHKAFADSVDNELIIQIHSYDSAGRVLPQSILSAVLDDEPNPPILDFANKFDIVSLTPLVPIAPNSIGNADHDSVSIRDFYSVFYNGGYYYDDEILISNSIGSLQGWDSPQARYSQLEHNPLEDDENFLHIEHDELPDVIREEILEFYPAEGVPTHNTYANAVEFYRPLYTAVGEYYHKSRFHNVPEEFETIQSSIDESFGGDTILVQPGIYTENINFRGKNLLLTSLYSLDGNRSFVNRTVINGNNSASVITFNGGEGVTAVLQGFTITNGSFENGGGIYCVDSSPTLDHCLIFGNRADAVGGAIFCQNSGPIILNCTISDNTSTEGGGAIFGWNGSEISIKNSILWDNSPEEISFLRFGDHNLLNLSFTDLAGGIEEIVLRGNAEVRAGDGNIEVDPLFADAQGSNYFLVLNSPCIDAGDPESPMDADSSRSDIGALPLQSQEISISHDVLDFDEVYLGRIDSLGLTITNIGQSPLTIFSLTVIPEGSLFTISGEMEDIKIEAESEHVTWVYFLADQADDYMAVLQIISDDLERDSIYVQMRATALTVKPDNEPTVHTFGLNNIYPNPFNSMAVVNYSLSLSGNMRIATYDIGGRLHSILKEGFSDAGRYDIEINASDLSTGVYFIKLETETELAVHKFVVVR